MFKSHTSVKYAACCLVLLIVGASAIVWSDGIMASSDQEFIPWYGAEVVASIDHDSLAFTQGLVYYEEFLYESTGLFGASTVRKIDPATGAILHSSALQDSQFGEGIAIAKDTLVQLLWKTTLCLKYDPGNLAEHEESEFGLEGWGLTFDGEYLIASDGSSRLYLIDPLTLSTVNSLEIRDGERPVKNLNELEYVEGEIFANVWHTNEIARISPSTGEVLGWIDLSDLSNSIDSAALGLSALSNIAAVKNPRREACLNGIAYDPSNGCLFVTGKLWPKIFQIKIMPRPRREGE